MKTIHNPSINGRTEPKSFWRKRSKSDPKAWEYLQGVGSAILMSVRLDEIPDEAEIKSGYWTKSHSAQLGCGCRVPKWITVKTFKAKDLKKRFYYNTVVLTYEVGTRN